MAKRGKRTRQPAVKSKLELHFQRLVKILAPELVPHMRTQFEFHPSRRWSFDFAWPRYLVAVEIDGGTWINGGHNRGSGRIRDCDKRNAATAAGWSVLSFTGNHLRERPHDVVETVVATLMMKRDRRESTGTKA